MRTTVLTWAGLAAAALIGLAGVDGLDTGPAGPPAAANDRVRSRTPAATAEPRADPPHAANASTPVTTQRDSLPRLAVGADARRDALATVVEQSDTFGPLADSVLADLALGHADTAVREEAIHALGEREGDLVLSTLQQALIDPSPRVRRAALRAFVGQPGQAAVVVVGSTLAQWDALARVGAVDTLGLIGGPDAMRYLESMLEDESPVVRAAAAEWLVELSAD